MENGNRIREKGETGVGKKANGNSSIDDMVSISGTVGLYTVGFTQAHFNYE